MTDSQGNLQPVPVLSKEEGVTESLDQFLGEQ